jgi:hypothetical protein
VGRCTKAGHLVRLKTSGNAYVPVFHTLCDRPLVPMSGRCEKCACVDHCWGVLCASGGPVEIVCENELAFAPWCLIPTTGAREHPRLCRTGGSKRRCTGDPLARRTIGVLSSFSPDPDVRLRVPCLSLGSARAGRAYVHIRNSAEAVLAADEYVRRVTATSSLHADRPFSGDEGRTPLRFEVPRPWTSPTMGPGRPAHVGLAFGRGARKSGYMSSSASLWQPIVTGAATLLGCRRWRLHDIRHPAEDLEPSILRTLG